LDGRATRCPSYRSRSGEGWLAGEISQSDEHTSLTNWSRSARSWSEREKTSFASGGGSMIGMFGYTSTRLSAMESVSVIQMLVVAVGCNGQLQLTQRNHAKLLSTRTRNKQFKTTRMSCDQHTDDTRRTGSMTSVCRSSPTTPIISWLGCSFDGFASSHSSLRILPREQLTLNSPSSC